MNRRSPNVRLGQACQMVTLEPRQLMSTSLHDRLWYIRSDTDRYPTNDAIVIEANPWDASQIRAVINGVTVGSVDFGAVDTIYVSSGGGDDRVLVKLLQEHNRIRLRVDGGRGNDTLLGGAGRDELRGGRGNDRLDGGAGADVLRGDDGNDDLAGDDGSDILNGDKGQDTLSGGWGRDQLLGGTGNDQLRGGSDGDFLYGNAGRDNLRGGAGTDRLVGGGDRDIIYRESARDRISGSSSEISDDPDNTGAIIRPADRDAWADAIIEAGLRQYRGQFGQPVRRYYYDDFGFGDRSAWVVIGTTDGLVRLSAEDATNFAASNVTGSANQDFSSTNTQVAGVDEADVVETDGRYIYSLTSGRLVITDVQNPSTMQVVSTTSLGQADPIGMFLNGSRLTVVSSVYDDGGYLRDTQVSSFDVSNPSAPASIGVATMDGSYQAARMIDGRVYVVVRNGLWEAYPRSVHVDDQWRTETETEYAARVREEILNATPKVTSTFAAVTTVGDLIRDGSIYMPADATADLTQLTTVAVFDTTSPSGQPVSSASYSGSGGVTYVSNGALYIVDNSRWEEQGSTIVKFGLEGTNVSVQATGAFTGYVNDQFSLDEYEGQLRVAYEQAWWVQAGNGIVVLDQVGDELTTVGQLDRLAPDERIYATRFIGDQAYVVTFFQADPLFTIDLSDPTNPTLVGELVIPGFSTYLHPLDENHLIGIGRGADENGWVQGVQVSLFDVTDRANPRRIDALELPMEGWGGSAAENNHLAFQFDPRTGTLLLPMSDWCSSRLELIKVDVAAGLERVGAVESTDYKVERSVWIGQNVFAVGSESIVAAEMCTAEPLDSVAID